MGKGLTCLGWIVACHVQADCLPARLILAGEVPHRISTGGQDIHIPGKVQVLEDDLLMPYTSKQATA